MNFKNLFLVITTSVFSALITIGVYQTFETDHANNTDQPVSVSSPVSPPKTVPVAYKNDMAPAAPMDFTYAAGLSTPGVVHIVSTGHSTQVQDPFQFGPFSFGIPQDGPTQASGSGVIISPDGYIVTNNHVIDNATSIQVITDDNQSFDGQVIGTDPSTDIALIKVDQSSLPYIPFGNSDSVKIGSWVLAVGNPFNLSSTVTAGIVSAKSRNINILEDNSAIESFIQTDAAINPGNSGGALVDMSGRLIGINTAIASPTGSYAGYGFAVPSNLVYKVVQDLKDYGIVQRGYLGVSISNITNDLAQDEELPDINGAYIQEVMPGSAADDAGLKKGDVIRKVNGVEIKNTPRLLETVAGYRPGDNISIQYLRKGKIETANVTLKNKNLGTGLLDKTTETIEDRLGIALQDLNSADLKSLKIKGGVRVSQIFNGSVARYTDMHEGFVITGIDREPVKDKDQLLKILSEKSGGVMLEGVYPGQAGKFYYAFGL